MWFGDLLAGQAQNRRSQSMQLERDISDLAGVVHKQREIAQEALDEARKIDELLKAETDPQKKQDLERIKKGAVKVVRHLVENAQTTSAVVASTISSIGELTRK
jgi:hypothetical protein